MARRAVVVGEVVVAQPLGPPRERGRVVDAVVRELVPAVASEEAGEERAAGHPPEERQEDRGVDHRAAEPALPRRDGKLRDVEPGVVLEVAPPEQPRVTVEREAVEQVLEQRPVERAQRRPCEEGGEVHRAQV